MEWQRIGSINLEVRGNIFNWSGLFFLDVFYGILGLIFSDDVEY